MTRTVVVHASLPLCRTLSFIFFCTIRLAACPNETLCSWTHAEICNALQKSIVQSADEKAEEELAKLAESRLALANKGFVSSDSDGEREGDGDDFAGADDVVLYTGPTSFAGTAWGAQAEGQAVAAAEQIRREAEAERASKQAKKAERRRQRALRKAERERMERGERQPGQY